MTQLLGLDKNWCPNKKSLQYLSPKKDLAQTELDDAIRQFTTQEYSIVKETVNEYRINILTHEIKNH